MNIGDKCNFVNQPEKLVYIGKEGCWNQFELISRPGKVWSEVLDSDLSMIELTTRTATQP